MRCSFFYFLLFTFYFSNAQRFGGNPPSVKWQQVNTDTVRIIFPRGLDSIAKRIATITSVEQQQFSSTIGNKLQKINIVLQPRTIFSNAYVALGPRRSEFYLTPSQNAFELGATSWPDLLSIHEYRHAEQYSNFNVGGSYILRILFGDNGQALANAAAIPDWFFEGDAVYNETILSQQGRGRLPSFLNEYKDLYLQNRNYNYMKLRNGSYKNFVPDHYPLGYMLVAYGKEKYGENFWKSVTQDAAKYKSLFYPMQHAVADHAHISFDEFVKNAFEYYQSQWQGQTLSNLMFLNSTERNNVIDEKYPYLTEDNSVIFLHQSYKEIPVFILKHSNGSSEKIKVQNISNDNYFSYNNGKIVYASFRPDPRWGNKEYNEIRFLNVETKEEKKITSKTRYFSPDISHNGKMIAAVELSEDESSKFILMDSNGPVLRSIINQRGSVYSYPKFSADDKFIYVCDRNAAGEMRMLKQGIEDGQLTEIFPYKNRIIGFPVVQGDTLFYTCSNNGRDEIWAYLNSTKKNYRVASSATGLYQAVAYKNKILTSAFTADGYRLANITSEWQPVSGSDTLSALYVSKPFRLASNNLLINLPARNFNTKNYKKTYNILNFHSWNPYFNDPDYSFILYGENVLNTFQSELYYTYNRDENFSRVGYTGVYGGWYLQPLLNVNKTWNRTATLSADSIFHWNETNIATGLQLPFNLTAGKFYRRLIVSGTYHYSLTQWQGIAKKTLSNFGFSYIQGRITFSQYSQQSLQQINPRWGQSILSQYRTGNTAHQILLEGYFYFPGLYKTHSLVLNFAFQSRDTSRKYFFNNDFPFSRGYTAVDYPQLFKAGINYHIPFCYPDWGFANLVYFLRIRANFFYDFTQAKSLRTGNRYDFASTGTEIFFDTKWWNQQLITFGVRYSRLLNPDISRLNLNQWQLVLPVNLY